MKKFAKYTDEPIGPIEIIENFLPPPEELVLKEDSVKVTLSLSSRSVMFFKQYANESNTSYQRMIRRLLDEYVARYTAKNAQKTRARRA